jgi:hypothetical protein
MITSMLVMLPGAAKAAPIDGWIAGTVTDGANPIDNAFVLYMPMMGRGDVMGFGWTDLAGQYNVTVIGGLQYLVMVFHGGYWATNATITVTSGATTVLDVDMVSVSPTPEDVTLTGFVKDELGNPVTVGHVLGFVNDPATMGEGPPLYGNSTAPDGAGQYTINVVPSAIGGGAASVEVPGYGLIDNSTTNPFVSGMTYWINITLRQTISTDDAAIDGHVTDESTGLPIEGVVISYEGWNNWTEGIYNTSFTDSSGYYLMNVTNGTANIWFSKLGYSSYQYMDVSVPSGTTVTFDAVLIPTVATIKGNVTVFGSGTPVASARVILTDGLGNYSIAITGGSGSYDLDAFAGDGLWLMAEADGYGRSMIPVNVSSGDTLYFDFQLMRFDSWLAGTVTDSFSGLPIPGAGIFVYNANYSAWESTNMTGHYNFTSLLSGHYNVDVDVMNYRHLSTEIEVLPGGNVVDLAMTPWMIPRTCMLWGYVNDSENMSGIQNAQVETGTGPPDYSEWNQTWTDSTGYYEMWIPPTELLYVSYASNHRHSNGSFNASGLTSYRLDMVLARDTYSPNVSYSQSPVENVSWSNPTTFSAIVEEIDPQQFALAEFRYLQSIGSTDYYYLIAMFADSFNPLSQSADNLPYSQFGDTYNVGLTWGTSLTGGWFGNPGDNLYAGVWEMWQGPNMYYGERAYYTNSSLMGWEQGTAILDGVSGAFLFFMFDNGMLPNADASDPTGHVALQVSEIQRDSLGGWWNWNGGVALGDWSVVGLEFIPDPTIPSGDYASVFSASDFGGHVTGNLSLYSVDNDAPFAFAGSDQVVIENTSATLDGSGSSDNVGIANWTWSFTDNGVPVVVYGEVATYNFTEVGSHLVVLTVTDGAGHNATDDVWVDVTADQPPTAEAGPNLFVMGGELVLFDGSLSSDDVAIVNWTWSFDYDGSTVYIYGESASFTFWIEGVYDVTLTVRDSSGQTDTDTTQVTVSGMIPEFPTLLLPVLGIAGLVVIVKMKRRR